VLYVKVLSPDIVVSADGTGGYIWRRGHLLRDFPKHRVCCAEVWDMWIAVGLHDGSVHIVDVYSGCTTRIHRPHKGGVTALRRIRLKGTDFLVSCSTSQDPAVVVTHTDLGAVLVCQIREVLLPGERCEGIEVQGSTVYVALNSDNHITLRLPKNFVGAVPHLPRLVRCLRF
jgi:hypothetical protein